MPVEIEAKMRVPDLAAVEEKLKQLGAKPAGQHLETNIFLDTEDKHLLTGDKGLRVRASKDLATGQSTYIITFKGPRKHGPLKSRDEFEVIVDSDRNALALLECLGYKQVMSFQKRRKSWLFKDCKIELDELPHLGKFVEVEGPSEPSVMEAREALGLSGNNIVKASYIALLATYLQEQGITDRKVEFRT